jgi:hypothetical protein
MRTLSLTAILLASTALAAPALDAKAQPKIQLAIMLDTSGSMDGLLNQTREQLWRIVNTFATAKREGQQAQLELALYEYGNDGVAAEVNHVRQLLPLTTNLDQVSEALFKLTTNGGSEYCGAAIDKALSELKWSDNAADLKLLYVAGNEGFNQGPVDFRGAVKRAISRGVVVNTIYAGSAQSSEARLWAEGAKLADGSFLAVDQNRAVARVDAPQDAELAKLSEKLNGTYVGYGSAAAPALARQAAQDKAANGLSASSGSSRAAAKASVNYHNSDWDLVDARKKDGNLASVPVASLPAPMQAMKPAEREAYVEEKAKERAALQSQIRRLSSERDAFVAQEMAKKKPATEKTLDDAVVESARGKAEARGFSLH